MTDEITIVRDAPDQLELACDRDAFAKLRKVVFEAIAGLEGLPPHDQVKGIHIMDVGENGPANIWLGRFASAGCWLILAILLYILGVGLTTIGSWINTAFT